MKFDNVLSVVCTLLKCHFTKLAYSTFNNDGDKHVANSLNEYATIAVSYFYLLFPCVQHACNIS